MKLSALLPVVMKKLPCQLLLPVLLHRSRNGRQQAPKHTGHHLAKQTHLWQTLVLLENIMFLLVCCCHSNASIIVRDRGTCKGSLAQPWLIYCKLLG